MLLEASSDKNKLNQIVLNLKNQIQSSKDLIAKNAPNCSFELNVDQIEIVVVNDTSNNTNIISFIWITHVKQIFFSFNKVINIDPTPICIGKFKIYINVF